MDAAPREQPIGQAEPSAIGHRLRWVQVYREAELYRKLYKAAVRLYTKPLFAWRKALSTSCDGQTLYDFARRGLGKLDGLHQALRRRQFSFQRGVWARLHPERIAVGGPAPRTNVDAVFHRMGQVG